MRRVFVTLLSLAASAAAQCLPARYTSFGAGCTGSGRATTPCLAYNTSQGNFSGTSSADDFAILASSGTGMTLCEVSFTTRATNGQPTTTTISIFDRPAGTEPGVAIGTTTLALSTILGVHTAVFVPPVVIPPQTDFFVVIDARPGVSLPLAPLGTPVTFYRGAPGAWSQPLVNNWKLQIHCCTGNAAPLLLNQGTPRLGGQFTTTLSRTAPNALAMLFTGFSDTNWAGITLPVDLTPLGAPGCRLLAPGTLIDVIATDAAGTASFTLSLPPSPVLCGSRIVQQWLVMDAPANALGIAFSNGGVGTVGN